MTVRTATPDDADAIERIRTDTWRVAYRGLLPDAVLDRLGYHSARRRLGMSAMALDRFALVAEHDGEVVGFCYGGPARASSASHPGEIYAIYVLPTHQGHGYGSALMRAGARELLARGWRGMVIWVLRDNHPSRRFYENMGGRYLADEEREIEGVAVTESGYVWDDLSALSAAAPDRDR